jgi:hypothetical protein
LREFVQVSRTLDIAISIATPHKSPHEQLITDFGDRLTSATAAGFSLGLVLGCYTLINTVRFALGQGAWSLEGRELASGNLLSGP